jgi:hypothetical protein
MPAKQELGEILGYASKPLRRLYLRRENSISRQQRLWVEETRFEWTTIEAEGRYAVEIERARLLAISRLSSMRDGQPARTDFWTG